MAELNATENFDAKMAELEKEVGGIETPVTETPVVETPKVETPKVEVPADVKVETPKVEIKPELNADGTPKVAPVVEAPAYVPNKEFNVKGKKYTFDPAFDSVLKDKETEDKVRQLYAKAYGLDEVSKSRDRIQGEYETVKKEIDTIAPARMLYGKSQEYLATKDLDNYGKALTASITSVYSENEILTAANILADKYSKPDMTKSIERDIEYHRNQVTNDARMTEFNNQKFDMEVQAVNREVDFHLTQPEVKKVQEVYDSIHGQGKFIEKVFAEGDAKSLRTGKTYPVGKNIDEIVAEWTPVVAKMANGAPGLTPPPQGTTGSQDTVNKVVKPNTDGKIPNISSAGSSGRTSAVKSMTDLDKLIATTEEEIRS